MNEVVFQLAVVFAPGLIWTSVADALCTTLGARTTTRTVTRAFGFGVISYIVYFAAYCVSWVLFALSIFLLLRRRKPELSQSLGDGEAHPTLASARSG